MRSDDAVAATGPDHGDACDLRFASFPALGEHVAKSLVREDAGKVIDAAIALRLANDRDDLVGGELARIDAGGQAGSILHALELDFGNLNRHRQSQILNELRLCPSR